MCVCVSLGREVQEQEISCSSKLKFMDTGPYCHPSLFLLPEKHSGSVMSAAGVDIKQDCNANTQRGSVRGALGGGVVFITGRRQTDRVQRDGTDVEDSAGRDWSDLKGNKTRGRGGGEGTQRPFMLGGQECTETRDTVVSQLIRVLVRMRSTGLRRRDSYRSGDSRSPTFSLISFLILV